MPFFKRSRSASSSSSATERTVSPLGASRYEQPYTPKAPQRRTPPHRASNGPENLLVAGYNTHNTHRRSPTHRTPLASRNHLTAPTQDLSSVGNWFEPKAPQSLTRNRPKPSYLHGTGPKRHGLAPRTGMPLVVTNEEPDFTQPPVRVDELDAYGSHAKVVSAVPKKETTRFSVDRSMMRVGPERLVRVVDVGVVHRLLPGSSLS